LLYVAYTISIYILEKTLMKNVLSLKFQAVLPDDERRDHNCEIEGYAKQG
jgi:hypothetical protein